MSDDKISVGDLVMIVKLKSCCGSGILGFVFTITEIIPNVNRSCNQCGKIHNGTYIKRIDSEYGGVLINRVKKIPPLKELETTEIKEELPA